MVEGTQGVGKKCLEGHADLGEEESVSLCHWEGSVSPCQ